MAALLPPRPAGAAAEVAPIEVREVATGKVVFRTTPPASSPDELFALSADGRHLAGVSEARDNWAAPARAQPAALTAEVWEVDSGHELGRFAVPNAGRVTSLAVAPGADRVVVGLAPYAQMLWPAPFAAPAAPPAPRAELKVPEALVWERATGRVYPPPLGKAPESGAVVTVAANGTTALRIDAISDPEQAGPPADDRGDGPATGAAETTPEALAKGHGLRAEPRAWRCWRYSASTGRYRSTASYPPRASKTSSPRSRPRSRGGTRSCPSRWR